MFYRQILRSVLIFSFLYLIGDAFFRWDGFRYYASFSEFLPSLALITILWSIVTIFISTVFFIFLKTVEQFCIQLKFNIKREHSLLFTYILFILLSITWVSKNILLKDLVTTFQFKLIIFLCITLISIFFTWIFRNRAQQLIYALHEHTTPLLWLLYIWIIFSIPLVTYYTWIKETDKLIPREYNPIVNERPNIILITFDALTARDMSVYGYNRPTTPFITKWAKTASVFTQVKAASNFTTPAVASLMTGKRVWTHRTYHILGSKPLNSETENLPLLLRKNGYFTMAFIVNPAASVRALGISNSFDIAPSPVEFSVPDTLFRKEETVEFGIIDGFLYKLFGDKIRLHDWIIKGDFIFRRLIDIIPRPLTKTTVPPEKAFNRFLSIIDSNPPEPFFAWIHLLPPHYPYLPPNEFRGIFEPSPDLGARTRARYDEYIRYCDREFEKFINQLKIRNKLDSSVIILSSDHGESFTHDYFGHGGEYLYEEITHIPLIIKEPGQKKGQIITDVVEQIDIPATILDLAHISIPSWMEGRSLVPYLRGRNLPSKPAFSMALERNFSRGKHKIEKGTIAVWEGDYKLIYYIETEKVLLFNLKKDPNELNNLFNKEYRIGEKLLQLIKKNLNKANTRIVIEDVKKF